MCFQQLLKTQVIFNNYWLRLKNMNMKDMKNSADQWGCYPTRPKAYLLKNFSYPTKAEFNNCFIIHSKYFPVLNWVSPFRSLICSLKITQSRRQVFFGQWFNNLQRAALLTWFWRHRFNNLQRATFLTSLIQYDEDSFQIWWTAAGYGELCLWF